MTQHYLAEITGGIWWPMGAKCATTRSYTAEDDAEAIERAFGIEAGDFSSVDDVRVVRLDPQPGSHCATCGSTRPIRVTVKEWDTEEAEMQYADAMFGNDY